MKHIIKNLLLFCYVFFICFTTQALNTPNYRLSANEIQSTVVLLADKKFEELDERIPTILPYMSADDFGILLEKACEQRTILNSPYTLRYLLTKYAPINLAEEVPININKYIYLIRNSHWPANSVFRNPDEYEKILINIFSSTSKKPYKLQPDISYPQSVVPPLRHSSDLKRDEKSIVHEFNNRKLLDKWKYKNIFLNTLANVSFLYKNEITLKILMRESSAFIDDKRIIWHAINKRYPIEQIEYFLNKFANPDGYKYDTPLLAAVETNNDEAVRLLVKNEANVDGYKDACPLYAAAQNDNIRIAEFLINNDANVNGYKYANPLFIATSNNSLKLMSILLAHEANVDGYQYQNPLYAAVQSNKPQILKLLLDAHANTNGFKENNPLSFAIENNFFGTAVLLLNNKANPNGYFFSNPLYVATAYKKYNIMKILLRYKANPNGYKEHCPLYIAAKNNDIRALKILLGATNLNINGYSPIVNPLWIATVNNFIEVIRLLLENKAAPNGYVSASFTHLTRPAQFAIRHNLFEALALLLKYGAIEGESP